MSPNKPRPPTARVCRGPRPPTRIDLGEYATWLDAERVVVNVYQRYRELDPDTPQLEVMALLVMQAEWLAKRSW